MGLSEKTTTINHGLALSDYRGVPGKGPAVHQDCFDPEAPDDCEHPIVDLPATTLVCDLYPVEG